MPDTATLPRAGLLTRDLAPVPLAGVQVDAHVSGLCARVTIAQRFVNREQTPIEAVYVFPLDEGAAVCGFEAVIDGAVVVGEVKDREEAFKLYDDAIAAGHGGYLLDEERPDVFQASVGNLPPGKEVLLKLTYVAELSVDEGRVRFVVPTTVSPRYAPAEDWKGVGRPDAEALNPPVAWDVPYGLDLTVRLSMPRGIGRIECPSHPVSIAMDGGAATVRLSKLDAALDRDFVLAVEAPGLDTPQAWIERQDDGSWAIAVAFAPALPHERRPAEIVFLVDRSGSMEGTSIEEVRNALQLCLRSMTAGCRFNIIGFGSRTDALFRAPREYDDGSLAEASERVARMQADLGGTELLPALEQALRQPADSTLPRQVVVLTDGEVTNTDAVLALGRQHADRARIFTFGIGAGASHHLVKGLARAGRGSAEFIYPGERIEPKVVRAFGRLLSPALSNVKVDWGGLDVTQAPSAVPPVFAGGRLLVYALLRGAPGGWTGTTVRLSADGAGGPVAFEVPVDPSASVPGRTVATLAARARIRELEEGPDSGSARGSRQVERKAGAARQEIVALAVRYGLLSRETSYVAVERRETAVTGDAALRRVPVALTTGWGGLGGGRAHSTPAYAALWMDMDADVSFCRAPSVRPARAQLRAAERASERAALESERTVLLERHRELLHVCMDLLQDGERLLRHDKALVRGAAWSGQDHEELLKREESLFDRQQELFGRAQELLRRQRDLWLREKQARPSEMRDRVQALVCLQRADGSWDLSAEVAAVMGYRLDELERSMPPASGHQNESRAAWATTVALAWLMEHAGDMRDEWDLLARKAEEWLRAVAVAGPACREAGREFVSLARPSL